ncbi:hypothetical protein Tco_0849283 [Tanacetum coccineum]
MNGAKFVTMVKLVKDLHTTNVDQHAHLQQHERHATEVRLMHERNPDPLALVASYQLTQPAYQSHLHTHPQSLPQHHISRYQHSQFVTPYQHPQFSTNQSTPLSITYPTNEYQSIVHHNVYSQQPSIPQLEYAPTTYQQQQPEFSQSDSSLVVPVFQKGDDPIDAINHMMSFLTAVVTSRYKEEVKDLKEKQNVENSFSGSNEQFDEIVCLKQNLFEHVQEKDCLMKTVSELTNKLKLEEDRNIEREIDLEKKIKQLDNIIFKRGQSAQTVLQTSQTVITHNAAYQADDL